jgi:cysteine synthase
MAPPPPVDTALDAIGDTPCVRLRHVVPDGCAKVYVKLEYLNPTGSYKDRMARAMIEQAELRGDLDRGKTVVEATGGSTGSSLAFVCAVKGYRFQAVSSDAFAVEKLRTMTAFGSTVDLVPSPSGQITANLLPSIISRAEEVSRGGDYYLTDQFKNRDALKGYEEIGHELVKQFPAGIDAFCGAAGGGGMVMGVASVLRARWPHTYVAVLEPESSPVISQGRSGTHGVDGISPGFRPPLLDEALFNEARTVSEDEARSMCRRLAREEGLLVGTSTGINVVAAIEIAKTLGPDKTVVTVACDTGLKYLGGTLFASK